MRIFDTNSTERSQIISVSKAQEFIAFGITDADKISVEIALVGQMENSFSNNGCSLIDNTNQQIPVEATAPYTTCCCKIEATGDQPRFVIDRPGIYVITFSGPSFGDAIVVAQDASDAAIRQFS
jgi:hypothetical protein